MALELKLEGSEGIGPSVFGRKDHRVMEMAVAMGSEPDTVPGQRNSRSKKALEDIEEDRALLCGPPMQRLTLTKLRAKLSGSIT